MNMKSAMKNSTVYHTCGMPSKQSMPMAIGKSVIEETSKGTTKGSNHWIFHCWLCGWSWCALFSIRSVNIGRCSIWGVPWNSLLTLRIMEMIVIQIALTALCRFTALPAIVLVMGIHLHRNHVITTTICQTSKISLKQWMCLTKSGMFMTLSRIDLSMVIFFLYFCCWSCR